MCGKLQGIKEWQRIVHVYDFGDTNADRCINIEREREEERKRDINRMNENEIDIL